MARPLTGAVAFVQRFGSALQLTPHFHVLVPEAVFEELDEAELRLHPLPRPTDAEVEKLAVTVARRTLALLRARGVLEEAAPDGALDVLQLEGVQVPRSGPRSPPRRMAEPLVHPCPSDAEQCGRQCAGKPIAELSWRCTRAVCQCPPEIR